MDYQKSASAPVAMITGAAGGIGRAITELLRQKGYRLALVDINQQALDRLKTLIGAEDFCFKADITDKDQVEDVVRTIISETGRLDVLVNNAGMVITKPFLECEIDELFRENELNYLSALYCIKKVLPTMQAAKSGTIVSIASLGGILPLSASPGYTASKAALRGLMLSLNMAFKPNNIHVGCVCPTAVDTPMLYYEATSGGSTLNFLQKPLSPEDVAKGVWQVISRKKMEVCLPWHEGISSKLGGFFPSILPAILPLLERFGERNRLKYLKQKQNHTAGRPS